MKKILITILILYVGANVKATTFSVLNTNPNGVGSFAQAIADANGDGTATEALPHIIEFSSLVTGDNVITGAGQLNITSPVIIDGATHPDGQVILDGNGNVHFALFIMANVGLGREASGSRFSNLVVNDYGQNALQISGVSNIIIDNCFIGTEADGITIASTNTAISMSNSGNIRVTNSLISGNTGTGISITNNTDTIFVTNNRIGVDITETLDLGNGNNGVSFNTTSLFPCVITSNIISNNGSNGVTINASLEHVIIGNTISANGSNGVLITNASNNEVNDNIINSNNANGVSISNSSSNLVVGNIIGLDENGITELGNGSTGISLVDVTSSVIGGRENGDRNLISGNNSNGVFVDRSSDNIILGNFIGTDISGSLQRPNFQGINIVNSLSTGNIVGDTTFLGRNVISSNRAHGIFFESGANNNEVYGNYVGIDSTGLISLGNGQNGISGTNAGTNLIGGISRNRRNIISGNGFNRFFNPLEPFFSGVSFSESSGLRVKGNFIGLGVDGQTEIPNSNYGIWYNKSTDLIVGGETEGERNVISGNGNLNLTNSTDQTLIPILDSRGIWSDSSSILRIFGNYIGTDSTGTVVKPNLTDGIAISTSSDIEIGGSNTRRNVISGNTLSGITLFNNTGVVLVGDNYLGVAADGNTILGNGLDGVYLIDQDDAIISNNIASGNSQTGIHLFQSESNQITNNTVGFGTDGTTEIGNTDGGIRIFGTDEASSDNTISQNTISNNTGISANSAIGDGYGIYVGGNLSINNNITENSIYCNSGLTIDIGFDGTGFGTTELGNEGKIAPVIDPRLSTSTLTIGTAEAGDRVEVYFSPSACGCDAEQFLGFATADAAGDWSFPHAMVDSLQVSALAIDGTGNTSEVSCKQAESADLTVVPTSVCQNEEITITASNYSASKLLFEIATVADFSTLVFDTLVVDLDLTTEISYLNNTPDDYFIRVISQVSPTASDTSSTESVEIILIREVGPINITEDTLCLGESTTLSVQNDFGTSYEWYDSSSVADWAIIPGAGNSGTSITVSPSVSSKYTVTPIGICLINSDTIEIIVNELITLDVELTVDTNDVCEGTIQTFTAEVTNNGDGSPLVGGATYTWEVENSEEQSGTSNEFITSSLENGDEVRITVEPTITTCLQPINYNPTSQIIIADINTMTQSEISITGDTLLCGNQEAEFTADVSGAGLNPIIEWFVNNISREMDVQEVVDTVSFLNLQDGDEVRAVVSPTEACIAVDNSNVLSIEVGVNIPFDLTIDPDYERCIIDFLELNVSSNLNESTLTFEWYVNGVAANNNSSTFILVPSVGDVITVGASTTLTCAITDSTNTLGELELEFSNPVVAVAGGSNEVDLPNDILLDGSGSVNGTDFTWNELEGGGSAFIVNDAIASVTNRDLGIKTFELQVSNTFCPEDRDTLIVTITGPDDVVIPPAFTPNGDGQNDKWLIFNSEAFIDIEVNVYNRWGSNVFTALNGYEEDNAWDGTVDNSGRELPEGAYYYVVTFNSGEKQKSGVVNILR